MNLDIPALVAKWQAADLTERQAAQSHFRDLCDALGVPHPGDRAGYTFEKRVTKTGGGQGYADVWYRDHFAWEYKGKGKDLGAAYQQLLQYREDLENPPLLVVCDLNRFEVHTNFTGTAKRVYAFTLADLLAPHPTAGSALPPLDVLRALFDDPARLRPAQTTAQVTEAAAAQFARLAESLRARYPDNEQVAHFLMRLLFCLFAEDIALLPRGLFTTLIESNRTRPLRFQVRLGALFAAMATGGDYGNDEIRHFNGGLFTPDPAPPLELTADELGILARAATLDWASVEPAIFGTLFERSLDPAKRAQLGAHYTSRDDILLIVEPVLMAPLRRRWATVQAAARALFDQAAAAATGAARARHEQAAGAMLHAFAAEIAAVRVLDPACGSGNFLYVALKQLLDLEKEVITFGRQTFFPQVTPGQLYGLEVNVYAHELASVVVWIGYIQWLRDNGFGIPANPVLRRLDNIRHQDAVLAYDAQGRPVAPAWPPAGVIIGNPPFLGGKKLRGELGSQYLDALFELYDGRVSGEADFVCYWFERARAQIENGLAERAGLLATNSIRQGANRQILDRIKDIGDIFMAWNDRPWMLNGAAVRVSMVGFDKGIEQSRTLDGHEVERINSDLSESVDVKRAQPLKENVGICLRADEKGGAFDITDHEAQSMLNAPININGRPNSDVIHRWITATDVTRRDRKMWIIDFGTDTEEGTAAEYEQPFEYILTHVKPERAKNNIPRLREKWWLHRVPGANMRAKLAKLKRYIVTPVTSKYRIFTWVPSSVIPDITLAIFAREDDYFFGILQSKPHELWSLRMGGWMGVGNDPRYTPTTTFETFPFPWPPGQEPADDPRVAAIAAAARDLVAKRDAWLAPPGADAATLKARTLTALYNARPTWLAQAHARLDAAVLAAYGWPADLPDTAILERLLALNAARAATPA